MHGCRSVRNAKMTSAIAWWLILEPDVGNTKGSFSSVKTVPV